MGYREIRDALSAGAGVVGCLVCVGILVFFAAVIVYLVAMVAGAGWRAV